jgi:septal ring factor EnvC (AmiA/AmiB activator)
MARRPGPSLAALLLLLALPAAAQADSEADQALRQVEEKLAADQAAAAALAAREAQIADEVAALTQRQVALAERAQRLERDLSDVEATLQALNGELAERRSDLKAAHHRLSQTLTALIQLALRPPEAALVDTEEPIEAARVALLLGMLVPELEGRAARLGQELVGLMELQAQIRSESENADAIDAALTAEREALAALLSRKESLAAITAGQRQEAEARAAGLAVEADDLRELIAELERQEAERLAAEAAAREAEARLRETQARLKAEAAAEAEAAAQAAAEAEAETAEAEASEAVETETIVASVPAAAPEAAQPRATNLSAALRDFPEEGPLAMPAAARLSAGWGDALPDTGEESRGLLLETRPGAQIVATFDGRVVYAGLFRRYGLILILEHGGRYHSLLAGLGRIDVVLGQWVVAGEPVGLMASPAEGRPALYLELRHNGQPIDPTPWFATQLSKGEG